MSVAMRTQSFDPMLLESSSGQYSSTRYMTRRPYSETGVTSQSLREPFRWIMRAFSRSRSAPRLRPGAGSSSELVPPLPHSTWLFTASSRVIARGATAESPPAPPAAAAASSLEPPPPLSSAAAAATFGPFSASSVAFLLPADAGLLGLASGRGVPGGLGDGAPILLLSPMPRCLFFASPLAALRGDPASATGSSKSGSCNIASEAIVSGR
mmetsp:Transcript_5743/g.20613  ORF Transcript_5743/g.20613 Transcript_5743/m.20613 type:complete len:211 (+) Transcript_5743:1865-2497(+)